MRGRFALRAKFPLASVPEGTEPKNHTAPTPLSLAKLQVKHMKRRLITSYLPPKTFKRMMFHS
ncbi:hypothetical protein EA472_02385 [Natrarchaeobius oligotrophus]|uniref:Uncharacterized protein n=1 Tax=Natrarchaeobius chitinivorans TaxID=1679083 RepID=A0A3N6PP66_NATCH|nr:hypothetical protein EA472_02385 [Natrarchaeobius chitinivorans]